MHTDLSALRRQQQKRKPPRNTPTKATVTQLTTCSDHEQLASQLEQQIRAISACFRLKTPRSAFSPSEWLVLSALAGGGSFSLKALTGHTSLTPASMLQIVRRLTGLGHIGWQRTVAERRHYALSITAKGRKTHALTREHAVRDNADCFAALTVDQLRSMTRWLARCVPKGKSE